MEDLKPGDIGGLSEHQAWMLYEIWESVRGDVRLGKLTVQQAAEVLRRLVQLLGETRG